MALLVMGSTAMGWAAEAGGRSSTAATARSSLRTGGYGFLATLDRAVVLTPEQKDGIRGLLAAQRQQTAAIRDQTDQRIRALLSPEQQKKFDAMIAEQKARRNRGSKRS
jgi:hypothetical protein